MPFVENFEITLSDNGRALWTFELDDVFAPGAGFGQEIDAWLRSEPLAHFFFDENKGRVRAQFDGLGMGEPSPAIEFGPFSPRARHLADQAQSFFLCPMNNGEMLAAFEMPALASMPRSSFGESIESSVSPPRLAARKLNVGGAR